ACWRGARPAPKLWQIPLACWRGTRPSRRTMQIPRAVALLRLSPYGSHNHAAGGGVPGSRGAEVTQVGLAGPPSGQLSCPEQRGRTVADAVSAATVRPRCPEPRRPPAEGAPATPSVTTVARVHRAIG